MIEGYKILDDGVIGVECLQNRISSIGVNLVRRQRSQMDVKQVALASNA
jgi:hypothetical protein